MKTPAIIGLIGLVASIAMLALGYWTGARAPAPQDLAAVEITEPVDETAELDAAIRDYLLRNPEVLIEVQETLQRKQEAEQRLAQQTTITSQSDAIFRSASDAVVANPDGAVSVVEFFDYNCGYCKRALDDMDVLIEQDGDLRFVLKGFPILGPDSHQAHIVSEAFKMLMPDKYLDFHRRLLGSGRANEARAMQIALDLGADETQLREAMKNPQIEENFRETYRLADALGITGTPSYVVADEVVFGAIGTAPLTAKIANARSCGSTIC